MKRRSLLGFSLIELMVVIGIIILIAAILFPVFATSLNKVRQLKCLSNQRQLAQAMIMYSNDYDDALPPYGDRSLGATYYWNTSLGSYLKNQDLLFCPKAPKSTLSIGVNYGHMFRYTLLWNASVGTWILNPPIYVSSFDDPSRKIMLGDTRAGLHMYTPKVWMLGVDFDGNGIVDSNLGVLEAGVPYNNIAIDRHNKGLNITFLDGHSKWCPGEQIINDLNLW